MLTRSIPIHAHRKILLQGLAEFALACRVTCRRQLFHGFLRISVFLILITGLRAHLVEQFYAEVKGEAPNWQIEVLFDVGYAKPEWRGDPDSPAPTREWLLQQSADEHATLRAETEAYLRDCLGFNGEEEAIEVAYAFPNFHTSPPDFPNLLTGGAYYQVSIQPIRPSIGPVRIQTTATDIPNFVFKITNQETGEAGYTTVSPGGSLILDGTTAPLILHALGEGYRHVVPLGLDHVLFILALFLLKRAGRPLFMQSLCFTIAHTITLGLTASGVIHPRDNIIEPLIALSIAALAIENLFVKEFRSWRYFTIFGFGLLHGMGFGKALAPVLIAGENFMPRLIATNLGVELAQISILFIAWLATMHWHETDDYQRVRTVANLIIGATALYWFGERSAAWFTGN